jgi:hypothetical protein
MIQISDSSNGLLTATLPMILNGIGADGAKLYWSLLYLSATGDLGDGKSIVDFEDDISASPNGFYLVWQELDELSHKFDQIFDILIVGSTIKESIKKYTNDEDLYSNFPIVIDLFDGAYWRVYASDEEIIRRLSSNFSDIKLSR